MELTTSKAAELVSTTVSAYETPQLGMLLRLPVLSFFLARVL